MRTGADEQLLALATRYGSLTLRQAAMACWGGQVETARTRVRLMTEAGLLFRSAESRWAGTVVWTTKVAWAELDTYDTRPYMNR